MYIFAGACELKWKKEVDSSWNKICHFLAESLTPKADGKMPKNAWNKKNLLQNINEKSESLLISCFFCRLLIPSNATLISFSPYASQVELIQLLHKVEGVWKWLISALSGTGETCWAVEWKQNPKNKREADTYELPFYAENKFRVLAAKVWKSH